MPNLKAIKEKYRNKYIKTKEEIMSINLWQLYERINTLYFEPFGIEVTPTEISWSNHMTAVVGGCRVEAGIIKLSVPYHRKYPEEIENTLTHELIHLYIPNHGPEFIKEMERINKLAGYQLVTVNSHERAVIRYVGVCPEHGDLGTRAAAPRHTQYYCKLCGKKIKWVKIN